MHLKSLNFKAVLKGKCKRHTIANNMKYVLCRKKVKAREFLASPFQVIQQGFPALLKVHVQLFQFSLDVCGNQEMMLNQQVLYRKIHCKWPQKLIFTLDPRLQKDVTETIRIWSRNVMPSFLEDTYNIVLAPA